MKVAIVTRTDASGGGASRVAADCATLLRGAGVEVDHWLCHQSPGVARSNTCLFPRPFAYAAWLLLGKISRRLGLGEELTPHYRRFRRAPQFDRYDLVHFHDTYCCFSPQGILRIADEQPTVWTLHDFTGLTDMCISPLCTGFPPSCAHCPFVGGRLLGPVRRRNAGRVQGWNREVHGSGKVVPVVPSDWMKRAAMQVASFAHEPVVIHNAVDLDVFHPISRDEARRAVGLPLDRSIVLAGSHDLADDRKNVVDAAAALRRLSSHSPLVLALGRAAEGSVRSMFDGLAVRYAGYVKDREQLALHYAAADCFLFTSKAETFGLQVAEAMACGVPAIAYDCCSAPELIDHRENGFVARYPNIEDLVAGLEASLEDGVREKWGTSARKKAERCFGRDLFLQRHLDLYKRVLAGNYAGRAAGRKEQRHGPAS